MKPRWAMVLSFALLLLGPILGLPGLGPNAMATTFTRSARPLTEDEELEYSVSTADAVLIGRVVGQVEHNIEVRPLHWLKGSGSFGKTTTVGFCMGNCQYDW